MVTRIRVQPLLSVVVAVTAFAVIAGIGVAVSGSASWNAAELQVVIAVNAIDVPWLVALASGIAVVFGPVSAGILTVLVMVGTGLATRSFPAAVRLGALIAFPWASADLVKLIVRRARPDAALLPHPLLVEPSTFSYPSGHTAFAVALSVAFVVVLTGRARRIALVVGVVVILLTAWSRAQLGAHYPSDVLASIVLVTAVGWAVAEATARIPWFEAADPPRILSGVSARVPEGGEVDSDG